MSEQGTTKDQLPKIRQLHLAAAEPRVESGPIAFGDDWPGVFIRGDHALMNYAPALERLLGRPEISVGWLDRAQLVGLLRTLQSCELVRP